MPNKPSRFRNIFRSLGFRLIIYVGLTLLLVISAWAYYNIKQFKERTVKNIVVGADRLGNTIRLGTHFAMKLNSRDDINQIINNIAQQKEIKSIRIYNKKGQIKFSNRAEEIDQVTNIKAEACDICHRTKPPLGSVGLAGRTRVFVAPDGDRHLGIISPIYNEPGCSTNACHVHPEGKKVLGGLDVEVSLKDTDSSIASYERGIVGFALLVFLGTSAIMGFFLMRFVNRPIKKLIAGTRHIGNGEYNYSVDIARGDEIGQLALAIDQMGREIGKKQEELNKQKEEYQRIFEIAPCYITVQDRNLRLIRYNREFAETFAPRLGDYCFKAYKGRSERCEICPVLKTFEDGKSHHSEEEGINKDGTRSFWLVRTSPIRDSKGEITAAMEMCLDVTEMKRLEWEVEKSEEKYRTIFNTMPNPIFVLDEKTLEILDSNDAVATVYGFDKESLFMTSFLNLFEEEEEREQYEAKIKGFDILNQVRQTRKDGNVIYVNIRVSASDYLGRKVLLVTTSDITTRLMAEQQLIQASKMATLGEMATGVAHELNQPLSVIKTASSYLRRKAEANEPIKDEILNTMAQEMDSHVDRASRIINHMREFGRKSDVKKEEVQVNEALDRSLDIFIQQLKLREIEVVRDLAKDLPPIMADSNRLEQVFVNLLINARDAIEEKWEQGGDKGKKRIVLRTSLLDGFVIIEIEDTGAGISKSNLDKVFEPFFTTKEVGKGTGLGLSISYGIVQNYDGTVDVETREGEGSRFIIKFPVPK